jgi:hypothetical protein
MTGEGAAGGLSRILPSRQHVPIVVAGARNAAISMVVRVFGLWSGTAVAVATPDGEGATGKLFDSRRDNSVK